ncbi:MAG: hypothetical protein IAG13_22785 [Deltaproteobacteria bacterium]|nr:hypothetical protein [Nannocystaceae bacterium]
MTRLHCNCLLLFGFALVPACVVDSKSLGQGEGDSSSAEEGSSEQGSGTSPDESCEPRPGFDCTLPYDGVSFGPCGGLDFDDSCCMRPTCSGNDDCADGEFCVPAGSSGLSCTDEDLGQGPECSCSADASGFLRDVCLPIDLIPADWCAGNYDEASCSAAPQQQRGENDNQFCQWIDVRVLTLDEAAQSCTVGEPEGRCLTIQQGFDPGCAAEPCGIGPEPISMANPYARFVDAGTTIEAFGVDDVFCGSGLPLGAWVRADDQSFSACAFSCGGDNPCAMSLADYADSISQSSKDAPVDECGDVDLDAPLAAWQAAHDCAVQHASMGQGFKVLWERQGIDSVIRDAAVGRQGESYGVTLLQVDQAVGQPYTLVQTAAAGLEATGGCTVEVGEMCLTPIDAGEPVPLCPG